VGAGYEVVDAYAATLSLRPELQGITDGYHPAFAFNEVLLHLIFNQVSLTSAHQKGGLSQAVEHSACAVCFPASKSGHQPWVLTRRVIQCNQLRLFSSQGCQGILQSLYQPSPDICTSSKEVPVVLILFANGGCGVIFCNGQILSSFVIRYVLASF
jgi:hypothetical protein